MPLKQPPHELAGTLTVKQMRDNARKAYEDVMRREKRGRIMAAKGTLPFTISKHVPGSGISHVRELDPDTRAAIDQFEAEKGVTRVGA
ncbi:hypothetical protein [Azorhizobium caulinodans]|uniref:hypothetical protein n=1 Tax=Azorhizobium caulinodans TaxID=7 RepID=UPI002FBE8B9D